MKIFDLVYDTLLNQYGLVLGDIENFDGENLVISDIKYTYNSPYVLSLVQNKFMVVKMQHFDYINCLFKDKTQYFIWKYFYKYIKDKIKSEYNENNLTRFDYDSLLKILEDTDKLNKDKFAKYLVSISLKNTLMSVNDIKPNKLYLLYNLSESTIKLISYFGKAKCELPNNSFKCFTSIQDKEYRDLLNKFSNNLIDYKQLEYYFNSISLNDSKVLNQKFYAVIEDFENLNPIFNSFSLNSLVKNKDVKFTYSSALFHITNNLRVFELCDLNKIDKVKLNVDRLDILVKPFIYYPIVEDLKLSFDLNNN